MSDLEQFNKSQPKTTPKSETKSINYYSIFENYKSNPVQRSTSLNSLSRYKNLRSSQASDDERSIRSMTEGIEYRSSSNFELPLEVINQLERHSLHGNIRRDSFRSRNGTKNFVLNPIFDERFESDGDKPEGDDEVFNTSTVPNIEIGNHDSDRLKPPNTDDYIETVFTDLNNLENGNLSNLHSNPLKRSKSFKSNQFSSHW